MGCGSSSGSKYAEQPGDTKAPSTSVTKDPIQPAAPLAPQEQASSTSQAATPQVSQPQAPSAPQPDSSKESTLPKEQDPVVVVKATLDRLSTSQNADEQSQNFSKMAALASKGDHVRLEIISQGMIQLVSSAMLKESQHLGMVQAGCELLMEISKCSDSARKDVTDSGGSKAILAGMKAHLSSDAAQVAGTKALYFLCESEAPSPKPVGLQFGEPIQNPRCTVQSRSAIPELTQLGTVAGVGAILVR